MAELKGVAGLPRICTPTTDLVRRTTQNDTCSQYQCTGARMTDVVVHQAVNLCPSGGTQPFAPASRSRRASHAKYARMVAMASLAPPYCESK